MKVFAISDLHLSTAVQKPMDIFGDGWQNHFQKICEDWKAKVSEDDVVLLGGDMSWGLSMDEAKPDYELVAALPGKKFVVKGNHDYYWTSLSKMRTQFAGFEFVQNNAYRICSNPLDPSSRGIVVAGSRGWSIPSADSSEHDVKLFSRELQRLELSLQDAVRQKQDGDTLIALLHYPPFDADYANTSVTDLLAKYDVDVVLYGHLHGKHVRIKKCVQKGKQCYLITSCDIVDNTLIEVCEV